MLSACRQLARSTAVFTGQPIERLLRDGDVATQHAILSVTHPDIVGRLLLGIDAGTPVV